MTSRPVDTSEEAWMIVQDRLRTLSVADKAHLANALSIDCERLARAGIVAMEPAASEARIRYILAERRYGTDMARAAFGAGD